MDWKSTFLKPCKDVVLYFFFYSKIIYNSTRSLTKALSETKVGMTNVLLKKSATER